MESAFPGFLLHLRVVRAVGLTVQKLWYRTDGVWSHVVPADGQVDDISNHAGYPPLCNYLATGNHHHICGSENDPRLHLPGNCAFVSHRRLPHLLLSTTAEHWSANYVFNAECGHACHARMYQPIIFFRALFQYGLGARIIQALWKGILIDSDRPAASSMPVCSYRSRKQTVWK